MSECDKIEQYERAYRAGKVSGNLWQYIPKRAMPGVTECFADTDGYWIYLDFYERGWTAYDHGSDCGVIHEYTIADIRKAVKTIDNLGVR